MPLRVRTLPGPLWAFQTEYKHLASAFEHSESDSCPPPSHLSTTSSPPSLPCSLYSPDTAPNMPPASATPPRTPSSSLIKSSPPFMAEFKCHLLHDAFHDTPGRMSYSAMSTCVFVRLLIASSPTRSCRPCGLPGTHENVGVYFVDRSWALH